MANENDYTFELLYDRDGDSKWEVVINPPSWLMSKRETLMADNGRPSKFDSDLEAIDAARERIVQKFHQILPESSRPPAVGKTDPA